jgi:hypothetical protein
LPLTFTSERPKSPSPFDKVFVIAQDIDTSGHVDLLGTCFSITTKHVITAYHNLVDDKGEIVSSFKIAQVGKKDREFNSLESPFDVMFVSGNAVDDWAILVLTNDQRFDNFFPVCEVDDLPNIPEQPKMRSFYYPIGQYRRNSYTELRLWCDMYKPALQYEGNRILLDGGLYRGSCGAPYVDRNNKVVALHLSSMYEGH